MSSASLFGGPKAGVSLYGQAVKAPSLEVLATSLPEEEPAVATDKENIMFISPPFHVSHMVERQVGVDTV